MTYESGKLHVSKGNVRRILLRKPAQEIKGVYWLDRPDVSTVHNAPTLPYWRQKCSEAQMRTMLRLVRDADDTSGLMAQLGMLDMEGYDPDVLRDPSLDLAMNEWVFHGTTTCWDAIYDKKGLVSTGESLDLDAHFKSSSSNKTAFVSTTRRLDVAIGFGMKRDICPEGSGRYGYVYLVYAQNGVSGNPKQAEVAIPGNIHYKQIFMFRWLGDLQTIYVNMDFEPLSITTRRIGKGIRLLCTV